jgi:hypothetical protein
MHQTRDASRRLWQGLVAAGLLALVLFSDAIIGTEPEASCPACLQPIIAGASARDAAAF